MATDNSGDMALVGSGTHAIHPGIRIFRGGQYLDALPGNLCLHHCWHSHILGNAVVYPYRFSVAISEIGFSRKMFF